jgi:hypothetical protein
MRIAQPVQSISEIAYRFYVHTVRFG